MAFCMAHQVLSTPTLFTCTWHHFHNISQITKLKCFIAHAPRSLFLSFLFVLIHQKKQSWGKLKRWACWKMKKWLFFRTQSFLNIHPVCQYLMPIYYSYSTITSVECCITQAHKICPILLVSIWQTKMKLRQI